MTDEIEVGCYVRWLGMASEIASHPLIGIITGAAPSMSDGRRIWMVQWSHLEQPIDKGELHLKRVPEHYALLYDLRREQKLWLPAR